jgi:hypothetical protein
MMPNLADWDTFYVIVGSSAGALIGLQFVVLTLIAEKPPLRAAEAGAAFVTPTIVHFSVVLLLSALIRAPWEAMTVLAVIWGFVGAFGIVYAVITGVRLSKQTAYRPAFEDWVFHLILPLVTYGLLALSPFTVSSHLHETLFGVAAATLMLLFVGIHNAWDGLAYHGFVNLRDLEHSIK